MGGEGGIAGEELVREAPERPHVRFVVVRLLLAQFGGEVERGADARLGEVGVRAEDAAETEVADDYALAGVGGGGAEDVGGLEVAVQDADGVQMREALSDGEEETPHIIPGEAPPFAFITAERSSPACSITMYRQSLSESSQLSTYVTTWRDCALRKMGRLVERLLSVVVAQAAQRNLLEHALQVIGTSRAVVHATVRLEHGSGAGEGQHGSRFGETGAAARVSDVRRRHDIFELLSAGTNAGKSGESQGVETHPRADTRVDRVRVHRLLRGARHRRLDRRAGRARWSVPRAVLELTARNFKFSERRSRSADGGSSFRRAARAMNMFRCFPTSSCVCDNTRRRRLLYHLLPLLVEDVPLEPQVHPHSLPASIGAMPSLKYTLYFPLFPKPPSMIP